MQMQRELKAIQQRLKTTFVFVTHDQVEAFGMSDRVALMNLGRVEQVGRPRDLYDRPLTSFAATFVGETNLFQAKVVRRDGAKVLAEADGLTFPLPADDLNPGDRVVLSLRPERIELVSPQVLNAVPASVVAMVFQGHVARLGLRIGSDREVVAVALNLGEEAAFGVGGTAAVTWPPDAVVVLRP
jgi:ABC-type Fe3+/spermidine/putrescine transport system ATPase subunit